MRKLVYGIGIILVLLGAMIVGIPAGAQANGPNAQLVAEGTFERDLSGWNVLNTGGGAMLDKTVKYDGAKALKFQGATGSNKYMYTPNDGAAQLTVDPTKSYELSLYVKTSGIATGKFAVRVLDFDAAHTPLQFEYYDVGGSRTDELLPATGTTEWTKVVMTLHPLDASGNGMQPNTDHIVLYLWMDDTSGTAWVDDVSLVETQFVHNGGFEQDLTGWNTANAAGGATVDTANKHSGAKALKYDGTAGVNKYMYSPDDNLPRMTVDPTKSYELSLYVKTSGITTGKFDVSVLDFDAAHTPLQFEYYDVGGSRTAELLPVAGTTGWTKLTTQLFPLDANGNGMQPNTDHIVLYLRLDNTTGTAWVDDITLKVKDTVNVSVDAGAAYNESGGNDMAKLKSYVSGTGDDSGYYQLNSAIKGKIKDVGIATTRGINFFSDSVTRDVYGHLTYDFTLAKRMVDDIVATGSAPHLIFHSMPQALSMYPDDPLYGSYQPASWTEYEDFVYQALKYLNVTNNEQVIYWEFGNENDVSDWYATYPLGGQVRYDKYWELYKHFVAAVNKYEADFPAAPRVKVGGPAGTPFTFNTMGWSPFNWLERMLHDANAENVRMDFVSYHIYGSAIGFGGIPKADNYYPTMEAQIASVKSWRNQYKPNAEIFVTEWGPNEDVMKAAINADNVGAAYYVNFTYAAMRTNGIDKLLWLTSRDYPEILAYETGTRNAIPIPGSTYSWFWPSMFTQDYVVKAPYNAMKMLTMTAGTRVAAVPDAADKEVTALAAKDGGKVTLLLTNHHWDYDALRSTAVRRTVNATVHNVSSAQSSLDYVMYRIDEQTSNAAYYLKTNQAANNGNSGLQVVGQGTVANTGGTVALPAIALDPEAVVLVVLSLDQDHTAPAVPVIATASQSVHERKAVVSGTAEAGARVELRNNGSLAGIAYADNAGNWSEELFLADGSNTIGAKAVDSHGNESAYSGNITITKSANTVAAPVLSGASTSASTTYTLTGTAQPGMKVNVYRNLRDAVYPDLPRKIAAQEVVVDSSGHFSVDIQLEAGEDNDITAQAYDAYGNVSPESVTKTISCTAIKNLIANGGWEKNYTKWGVTAANGMLNLDSVNAVEGNSIKWTGDGASHYIYNPVDGEKPLLIDSTKSYELSVYLKTSAITSGGIYIAVLDKNGNSVLGWEHYNVGGVATYRLLETSGTTSGFVKKTITLTPHQPDGTGRWTGTDRIYVYVFSDANAGGFGWADSMFLRELT